MTKRVYASMLLFVIGPWLPSVPAAEPSARVVKFHNYDKAIQLGEANLKVVISPQAGGRVLEYSTDGKDAMWLDDKEKDWQPGAKSPMSAGRFDYGPELTVAPHPTIWSGDWTSEIVDGDRVRLTSPRDEAAGVQLIRDFRLCVDSTSRIEAGTSITRVGAWHLDCRQTIKNIGDKPIEVCHWGRSFSPGGGIALVPLGDRPSRFPSRYAMYEESATINVRNVDEKIRERDGFLEILGPPRKPKLGFDTYAGWMAYLMPNDLLFVKRFAAYPDRPYNEAAGLTLSIWYPEGPRIELEPIGPRERLVPAGPEGTIRVGDSATFTESWFLLTFPFPKQDESIDLKELRRRVEAAFSYMGEYSVR